MAGGNLPLPSTLLGLTLKELDVFLAVQPPPHEGDGGVTAGDERDVVGRARVGD